MPRVWLGLGSSLQRMKTPSCLGTIHLTQRSGTSPAPTTCDLMLRGEIRLVNLDPVVGAEASKRRPAVIVSNDSANAIAARVVRGVVTVVPVTSDVERVHPCPGRPSGPRTFCRPDRARRARTGVPMPTRYRSLRSQPSVGLSVMGSTGWSGQGFGQLGEQCLFGLAVEEVELYPSVDSRDPLRPRRGTELWLYPNNPVAHLLVSSCWTGLLPGKGSAFP